MAASVESLGRVPEVVPPLVLLPVTLVSSSRGNINSVSSSSKLIQIRLVNIMIKLDARERIILPLLTENTEADLICTTFSTGSSFGCSTIPRAKPVKAIAPQVKSSTWL